MNAFFALLLVLTCAFAGAAQTSARGDLERLLKEFLAGASANDASVHERFWADDLIYTRASGQRTGKAEIMRGVRSAPAAKPGDPRTVYTAEDVRVLEFGRVAVVAFRLVGTTDNADGKRTVAKFHNTGTFVKRGGRWQAVAWQATRIPEDEK